MATRASRRGFSLMFHVRSATLQDLDAIFNIEQVAQAYPWSRSNLQASMEANDQIFLMTYDKQVAGYIIFCICLDEAEILNFAIHPNSHRQGLGRQLLEYGMQQMSKRGVKKVFLEVRYSNQAAISLYQRAGFKQFSIRKGYYTNGKQREDALLFCFDF